MTVLAVNGIIGKATLSHVAGLNCSSSFLFYIFSMLLTYFSGNYLDFCSGS